MLPVRDTLARFRRGARSLAHVARTAADRAQRAALGVVPRAEFASGVEGLAAQRESFRLAVAEYLLGSLSLAATRAQPVREEPPEGVLHVTRVVETRLEQLHRYREFWRDQDPAEAVHQLRVASRRLRAFVDLFAQFCDSALVSRTRKELKSITRAVRDLRDLDVMLIDVESRFLRAQADEEAAALRRLLKRLGTRRRRLVARAKKRMKRVDLDALGAGLRRMLDDLALRSRSPSATYELLAQVTFDRVMHETRSAFPKFAHLPRPEELHAFRLRVKRLRYSAELVEPVLGDRFSVIHRRAKQIQEVLGDHQDRVVLAKTLDAFRNDQSKTRGSSVSRGLDRLILRVRGEREQLFERFANEYAQKSPPKLFAP